MCRLKEVIPELNFFKKESWIFANATQPTWSFWTAFITALILFFTMIVFNDSNFMCTHFYFTFNFFAQ